MQQHSFLSSRVIFLILIRLSLFLFPLLSTWAEEKISFPYRHIPFKIEFNSGYETYHNLEKEVENSFRYNLGVKLTVSSVNLYFSAVSPKENYEDLKNVFQGPSFFNELKKHTFLLSFNYGAQIFLYKKNFPFSAVLYGGNLKISGSSSRLSSFTNPVFSPVKKTVSFTPDLSFSIKENMSQKQPLGFAAELKAERGTFLYPFRFSAAVFPNDRYFFSLYKELDFATCKLNLSQTFSLYYLEEKTSDSWFQDKAWFPRSLSAGIDTGFTLSVSRFKTCISLVLLQNPFSFPSIILRTQNSLKFNFLTLNWFYYGTGKNTYTSTGTIPQLRHFISINPVFTRGTENGTLEGGVAFSYKEKEQSLKTHTFIDGKIQIQYKTVPFSSSFFFYAEYQNDLNQWKNSTGFSFTEKLHSLKLNENFTFRLESDSKEIDFNFKAQFSGIPISGINENISLYIETKDSVQLKQIKNELSAVFSRCGRNLSWKGKISLSLKFVPNY